MNNTIKCLSIRQPYASWLCNPGLFIQAGIEPKTIENRDWYTRFRGDFLIHASRTFEDDALDYWSSIFPQLEKIVPVRPAQYPKGVILGRARLVDVVQRSASRWFCGDYGFVLADARLLEQPVSYKGQLGFFDVPLSALDNIPAPARPAPAPDTRAAELALTIPAIPAPRTNQTLYTFGYLSGRAERIISELIAVHTPLVDIRFNPTSRNYRYTQAAFQARPGVMYVYVKGLGNELYQEALTGKFDEPHVRLHDAEHGLGELQTILNQHGRAAIFCACSNKTKCHRLTVAELASARLGVKVVHL